MMGMRDRIVHDYLTGVDWVIAGGESGPRARPMDPTWVVAIRDQCRSARVPFFFRQWGGTNKKKAGRLLDGRVWNEMPRGHVMAEVRLGRPEKSSITSTRITKPVAT
jgi:protein gp37